MIRVLFIGAAAVMMQALLAGDPGGKYAFAGTVWVPVIAAALAIQAVRASAPLMRVEQGVVRGRTDRLVAVTLTFSMWGAYIVSGAPPEVLSPQGAALAVAAWWIAAATIIVSIWRSDGWAEGHHEAGVLAALHSRPALRLVLAGAVVAAAAIAYIDLHPSTAAILSPIPLVVAAGIRVIGQAAVRQIQLDIQGHVSLVARHLGVPEDSVEVLNYSLATPSEIDAIDVQVKTRLSDSETMRALDRALDEAADGWQYDLTGHAAGVAIIRGEHVGVVDADSRRIRRLIAGAYAIPVGDVDGPMPPDGRWTVDLPDGLDAHGQKKIEERVAARLGTGWEIVTDWKGDVAELIPGPDRSLPDVVPAPSVRTGVKPSDPWWVGVDDRGERIEVNLAATAHMLIAGATRSGKSVCTYGLITHVIGMGASARLYLADPNDTTAAPWLDHAYSVTTDVTPREPIEMLRAIRSEMDRRKPLLREMRADKVSSFTPDLPMLVVIVDEAANYLRSTDKKARDEFADHLLAVVSQGAKYGVRLVLITQRPDSTILPTATRAQLAQRICFRVEDRQSASMVFPEVDHPDVLLGLEPGVGWFREPGERLRTFRGPYWDDPYSLADALPIPQHHRPGATPHETTADPAHEPTGEIPPVPHEPNGEHPPVVVADDLEGW